MLSVCTYHIKNHKCRERSQKKGLFPFPQQYPSCSELIYAAQRSRQGERNTHFHVSLTNATGDLRWHIETAMYTNTHVDVCTHTLKVAGASVSCRYNLQSDTWRWANNYKAIKQANPGGVETMIKRRWGERWQIAHCKVEALCVGGVFYSRTE